MQHPTDNEFADSVAAVREAAAELRTGQAGRPAQQVLQDLCDEFGVAQ